MKKFRYPGAHPFTQAERDIFFGRKKDIEELFRLIEMEKLIVLFSISGMGKSSLLNAGVLPLLEESGEYQPVRVRLGASREGFQPPAEYTKTKLSSQFPNDADRSTFLERLVPGDHSLWTHIKRQQILHEGAFKPILVFDQFEELFTYSKRSVFTFKKELGEVLFTQIPQRYRDVIEAQYATAAVGKGPARDVALSDQELRQLHEPIGCKVVFAIRADRYSLLNDLASHLPNVQKVSYQLKPLTSSQAEDAILFPAYKRDPDFISPPFDYQNEALDKMLKYLTRDGQEPIESFQLQILCQAMERKVIDYQIKQITEADLGNLENIYQNYYDNEIAQLGDEEEQKLARTLIEDGLILEEEARRLTLYEGQINREYHVSSELLAKLVDSHLLRAEASARGGFTYELSHDTLVGPVLRAKRKRKAAEERRLAQEETLRKERELELVRREKEEEMEKRRRMKRLAVIAGIAAVVAVAAFLAAMFYARYAEKQKSLALSNGLIALANELKDRNPTYALHFADAAVRSSSNNDRARTVYNRIIADNAPYGFYQNEIRAHGQILAAADLNGPQSRIVTGGADHKVRIWSQEGELLNTLEGHTAPVLTVASYPDSNLIVTAGADRSIRFWRLNGNALESVISVPGAHRGDIACADISANGKMLATGGWDGVVQIRETGLGGTTAGKLLDTLMHPERVFDLSFSPLPEDYQGRNPGTFLLTGCEDNYARIWKFFEDEDVPGTYRKLEFDKPLDDFHDDKDVYAVAFSPLFPLDSNNLILTGNLGQTVKIWKVVLNEFWNSSTDQEAALLIGERGSISAAKFGPMGTSVLAADEEGRIKYWDLSDNIGQINRSDLRLEFSPDGAFRGHTDKVSSLVISRDGMRLFSGSLDGTLKIWTYHSILEKLDREEGEILRAPSMEALRDSGVNLARVGLQPSDWDNYEGETGIRLVDPYPQDVIPPSDVAYKLNYVQYYEDRIQEEPGGGRGGIIRSIFDRYFSREDFQSFSPGDKLLFLKALVLRREALDLDDRLADLYREKTDMAVELMLDPAFYDGLPATGLYELADVLLEHFMYYDDDRLSDSARNILREILNDKLVPRARQDLDFPGQLRLFGRVLTPIDSISIRPELYDEYMGMARQFSSLLDENARGRDSLWRPADIVEYLDLAYRFYKTEPDSPEAWRHFEDAINLAMGQLKVAGQKGELNQYKSLLLQWGERRISEGDSRLGQYLENTFQAFSERATVLGMQAADLKEVGKAFYESSYRYAFSDSLKAFYRQQAVNFLENANYIESRNNPSSELRQHIRELLALSQGSLSWRLLKLGKFDEALHYAAQSLSTSKDARFVEAGQMAITNLVLAYLFTDREIQAADLYQEYRDQKYIYRPEYGTFKNVFVKDLAVFRKDEDFARFHPRIDRVLDLLGAELPN